MGPPSGSPSKTTTSSIGSSAPDDRLRGATTTMASSQACAELGDCHGWADMQRTADCGTDRGILHRHTLHRRCQNPRPPEYPIGDIPKADPACCNGCEAPGRLAGVGGGVEQVSPHRVHGDTLL
eukprot:Sspe_Gene.70429::Locus_41578_Transcript_1_3_Confidence_0.667_Length_506::g.70429::m.70429